MNPTKFRTIAIRSTFSNTIAACLVVALVTMFFCEVSLAQSSTKKTATSGTASNSKLQSFLEKKDANGNGSIEPDEMSENTKAFLSKMGLNTDKAIKITKVIKVNGKAIDKATGKAKDAGKPVAEKREQTNLKVPGFGGDRKSGTVNSFNSSASSSSKNAKTYSDSVIQQVERTLERYDRNQDGVLDEGEMSRARWGSPRPSNSDLNGDGRLSKNELSERYAAREKSSTSSSDWRRERSSRSSDRDREGNSDRDRDRKNSDKDKDSDRSQYSRRSSSYSENSNRPKTDDRVKYQKYAQSLMRSYDKDKDGRLDKDELKKLRRPPPGADANDDGFVSEAELAEAQYLASVKKTTSSVKPKQPSSGSSRSSSSSRKRTSSSSRSRISKLDTNGDNQIQMHEFSDEWDEEVVAEYYEADKNRDGVITEAEWSDR